MVRVFSVDGKESGNVELPDIFKTPVNYRTLNKAFLAEESEKFQLKYTDPMAGKRKVARLTKRRRSYKTSYGRGLDRTPRKTLSKIGTNFSYVGAVAPNTVGGREAHPPVAEKNRIKEINKKEKKLAIRMGIAASADINYVSKFHRISGIKELPVVIDGNLEDIKKTKDAVKLLSAIGLENELDRVMERKIRSGKGKMRGRKYRKKLGIVIVTAKDEKVPRAFYNINTQIRSFNQLTVSDVSQAGRPGRLLVCTKKAVDSMR